MRRRKLIFLLILLITLIVVILILVYILYLKSIFYTSGVNDLHYKAEKVVYETSNQGLNETIKAKFDDLKNDELSDQEKYNSLFLIRMNLSSTYNKNHDPKLRSFINNELIQFAKNNFSKEFKENDFLQTCSDLECGEKISAELEKIITDIKRSNIPPEEIETILYNLELAAYIPADDDLESKRYGYGLVVWQLNNLNSAEASNSAKSLKEFFVKNYKEEIYELE